MKKLIKILPIIMAVLAILSASMPIYAATPAPASGGGQTIAGVPINPSTEAGDKISGIGNNILGIIQVVGTIIAVGVLMVIGIKYMMGSAEEKAEYKKTMLPYLIGAVILFAAVNIAAYVVGVAETIT